MDDLTARAIARWIEKAERDLPTARTFPREEPRLTDVVCYHCQQCAEKALKAFLVRMDVHIEKTHYLRRLLTLCSDHDPAYAELDPIATGLSDYATVRYPDDWREIPGTEAAEAVLGAAQVLAFVKLRVIAQP
ncbi:MAG: HEPN domain-containing protein [Planctomycetes bacterium]|nr:HEPN domain-containing protein [Planctomycetota bacterium]